jgi:hypothetical protein
MSTKKAKEIENRLIDALLNNGVMVQALYDFELTRQVDGLKKSMQEDNDDYIFTVTENNSDIAMLLIEKSGKLYINERAREKLKTFWLTAYEKNIQRLIPMFTKQFLEGELPFAGVKEKLL